MCAMYFKIMMFLPTVWIANLISCETARNLLSQKIFTIPNVQKILLKQHAIYRFDLTTVPAEVPSHAKLDFAGGACGYSSASISGTISAARCYIFIRTKTAKCRNGTGRKSQWPHVCQKYENHLPSSTARQAMCTRIASKCQVNMRVVATESSG